MRLGSPKLRLDGPRLTVAATFTTEAGRPGATVEVTVDRQLADMLDPGPTPWVPLGMLLSTVLGEDLIVDGPVDSTLAASVSETSRTLARWWGYRPSSLLTGESVDLVPTGESTALFFTRGVDSWSTLLDLQAAPAPERVSHLLAVSGVTGGPTGDQVDAENLRAHRRTAGELGLPLLEISTDVRQTTDLHVPWIRAYGSTLVSTGLILGAGIRRLVLSSTYPTDDPTPTGWHRDLAALSTGATEVVLGNPSRTRLERTAHVAGDPRARRTLQVCWQSGSSANCGRCLKCLMTMTELLLAGDPHPSGDFDGELTPEAVRAIEQPMAPALIEPLVAALGAAHEDLRRAWRDQLGRSDVDADGNLLPLAAAPPRCTPDAGPPLEARIAGALRQATGDPDTILPRSLGWERGQLPLRPAAADHARTRTRLGARRGRTDPWAVIEEHDPDRAHDASQAALADRCTALFGRGVSYLPGIGWAPGQPPVLGPEAVGRLLMVCRARLWWRDGGGLDPLRTVEAIEHGCIPYQVMPAGAADTARSRIPAALAPLVVAIDDLAALDLDDDRAAAVDHLLTGSVERDLLAALRGG